MPFEAANSETQRTEVIRQDLNDRNDVFQVMIKAAHGALTQFGVTESIDPENPTEAATNRIMELVQPIALHHGITLNREALLRVATAVYEHNEQGVTV